MHKFDLQAIYVPFNQELKKDLNIQLLRLFLMVHIKQFTGFSSLEAGRIDIV